MVQSFVNFISIPLVVLCPNRVFSSLECIISNSVKLLELAKAYILAFRLLDNHYHWYVIYAILSVVSSEIFINIHNTSNLNPVYTIPSTFSPHDSWYLLKGNNFSLYIGIYSGVANPPYNV